MHIPDKLKRNVINRWGSNGQAWLDGLAGTLAGLERRFGFVTGTTFENTYCNYVANAATHDGRDVVVKISCSRQEFSNEIEALRAYNGRKSVRILGVCEDVDAVVLEKAVPGYDLASVADEELATRLAAEVIRDLPCEVPVNTGLPSRLDWFDVGERMGTDHGFPMEMFDRARRIATWLENSKKSCSLLHGDLHHYNILYDETDGWLAIDPQGVTGDPVSEVGQFFHNPEGIGQEKDLANILRLRAEIFADVLTCDIQRVIGWGFVQCVIACCWSIEDNEEEWQGAFKCAEALCDLME